MSLLDSTTTGSAYGSDRHHEEDTTPLRSSINYDDGNTGILAKVRSYNINAYIVPNVCGVLACLIVVCVIIPALIYSYTRIGLRMESHVCQDTW